MGGARNGLTAWKEVTTGQSYGDWQAGHTLGPVSGASPAEVDFGWVPFFQALGRRLLDFHAPDQQLVLLRLLREAGIAVNHDEGEELTVIDPFTFVSLVLKHKTDKRVHELFTQIGAKLGLTEPAPTSTSGVPWSNPMNAWFFPYRSKRQPDDLE